MLCQTGMKAWAPYAWVCWQLPFNCGFFMLPYGTTDSYKGSTGVCQQQIFTHFCDCQIGDTLGTICLLFRRRTLKEEATPHILG